MAEIRDCVYPEGWSGRIAFGGRTEPFAYVPDQIVVAGARGLQLTQELLGERIVAERTVLGHFTQIELDESVEPLDVIERLRFEGVVAQPNHVLFAHCDCGCWCPPHPATRWQGGAGPGVAGNPLYGNPLYGNPLYGNPLYGNPLYGNAPGSPVYMPPAQATGHRHSSAVPAGPPASPPRQTPPAAFPVTIAVLDTGLAMDGLRPHSLDSVEHPVPGWGDRPDADGDGFLDPAVGHGTFISGLLGSLAPGVEIIVERVLDNYGAGDEVTIATAITGLPAVDILNLSLGGYALGHMDVLATAVRTVQRAGTVVVASAGNDGICRPVYPAAFPDVIGVAALSPNGPAPFSNFGPWIRACAPGVDVVSSFFTYFQGPEPAPAGYPEPDRFTGWARWSGTSFAAPTVAAAIAREMQCYGLGAGEAAAAVVDSPGLLRIPDFGTVVDLG